MVSAVMLDENQCVPFGPLPARPLKIQVMMKAINAVKIRRIRHQLCRKYSFGCTSSMTKFSSNVKEHVTSSRVPNAIYLSEVL